MTAEDSQTDGEGAPALAPPRVLVADDDPGIRDVLRDMLERAGFRVDLAIDGEQALSRVRDCHPDLLLLDVDMPRRDGWEVVKRLKSDPILQHLPVLFLTSLSQTKNKVHGLELGANDYITKPFNPHELLARVQGVLKQTRLELEANPLSRLPGNPSIDREINARIRSGVKFAVLYADLNNFKAFNDYYGFKKGDELIREAARVLLACRNPGDFVGHVGGDDFIVVTKPAAAEATCRKIIAEFAKVSPSFYDPETRKKGYIEVADRQGRMTRFPLAGFSVGAVSNSTRPLKSLGQVAALGSEMKKFAKTAASSYVFDRRTG